MRTFFSLTCVMQNSESDIYFIVARFEFLPATLESMHCLIQKKKLLDGLLSICLQQIYCSYYMVCGILEILPMLWIYSTARHL